VLCICLSAQHTLVTSVQADGSFHPHTAHAWHAMTFISDISPLLCQSAQQPCHSTEQRAGAGDTPPPCRSTKTLQLLVVDSNDTLKIYHGLEGACDACYGVIRVEAELDHNELLTVLGGLGKLVEAQQL
jgi:hypothetical protein